MEGPIYTRGNSFRARAEEQARKYRLNELGLKSFGKYGHLLALDDMKNGMNFINQDIFKEAEKRQHKGKGVEYERTFGNMLSSQAMCFNLFVPLNQDKSQAILVLNSLLGLNIRKVVGEIQIEFTPPKHVFNDQSGRGGVDCDILIEYLTEDNQTGLLVIETKYVEEEFSICGFRKPSQPDKCNKDLLVNDQFNNCRYQYKRHYLYWQRTIESGIFKLNDFVNNICPFGGPMWQMWVNTALASAMASEKKANQFHYVVLCPKGNTKLSQNGAIWEQYKSLLAKDVFKVIYLEDFVSQLIAIAGNRNWIEAFAKRYIVTTPSI